MRRSLLTPLLCALAAAFTAGSAAADGGPSPGIDYGSVGIVGPRGQLRYVAVPGQYGTVVEAIRVRGGQVHRWLSLRGSFGVPFVTNDRATGGLSHDGKTLVLSSYPTVPASGAVTKFAVLNTSRFRVRQIVTLRGSYSFDALSPDASTLYLIQYTSAQNYNRYRVRAYDLEKRQLLPQAIVDKSEPAEAMAGSPLTRTATADGEWAYTLYARQSGPSFIHALNTVHRFAVCLDLEVRAGQGLRLALSRDQSRILILRRNGARLAAVRAPG